MKKNIILLFLMLLIGLLFTGCADISYQIKVDKNNAITQTITVKPNYELLSDNGYSKETVCERTITTFKDIIKNQENNFKNYEGFAYQIVHKDDILKRITYSHIIEDISKNIILEIKFSSYSDFVYYYGLVENALKDNDEILKTPFYYYQESTTKSIFSSLSNENSLVKYIKQMFSFKNECPFGIDDLDFNYIYAVADGRQRSNADSIYYKDGYYHHLWHIPSNNLQKDIFFYKFIQINSVNWYYLAIASAFILFVILMVINEIILYKKISKPKIT